MKSTFRDNGVVYLTSAVKSVGFLPQDKSFVMVSFLDGTNLVVDREHHEKAYYDLVDMFNLKDIQ